MGTISAKLLPNGLNGEIPHGYEVDYRNPSKFDPMLGFPNGRKVREMPISHDDMVQANIPLHLRDYCADKYLAIAKCYRDTNPSDRIFSGACDHEKHIYEDCEYQDYVIRHKEWERERRLIERQKRRIAKGLEFNPETAEISKG